MKIRAKILCGFAVMAVIAVALGIVGLITTYKFDGLTTELKELQHESVGVSKVLSAHYVWRQNLTEAVLKGSAFTGSLDPNTCALGTWRNSDEAKNMDDPELLSMLGKLDAPHAFIHTEAKNVVSYIEAGNLEAAKMYLENTVFPETEKVISILADMQGRFAEIVEMKDNESIGFARLMEIINVVLIVVTIIACIFLSLLIAGMVSKPLTALSAFMRRAGDTGDIAHSAQERETLNRYGVSKDEIGRMITDVDHFMEHITHIAHELESLADGDLTTEIEVISENDTMGRSVKHLADNLNSIFSELNSSSAQVAVGSKQIADGAQALAQGSTQQAASVEQLSASISQIAQQTQETTDKAGRAAGLSASIKETAEQGKRNGRAGQPQDG